MYIKQRIDNSIEKHKIAFSGIYKERIDVYRNILQKIYDISRFHYFGIEGDKIMLEINSFINYYLVNQLFLSDNLLDELKKCASAFQNVFDSFLKYHGTLRETRLDANKRTEIINKFTEVGNTIKQDHPFGDIAKGLFKK